MAAYTRNEVALPVLDHWYNLVIGGENPPVSASDTLIVLLNSDGTHTRIIGSGFTYDGEGEPIGGTVSSVTRTDATGTTTYEQVTGLTLALVDLWNTEGNPQAFAVIFQGADTFTGWSGADLFVGGAGADSFNGQGGFDFVSYDNALSAVSTSLPSGTDTTKTGDAVGDTYTNIEGLIGSAFNDNLRGNGNVNTLIGGAGNDFLRGRGGGDTLDGGTGFDTADYFNAANLGGGVGVTVDLATPTNNTGEAAGDTFISIEHLRGSAFNDILRGDGASNQLDGHSGNDQLDGGAGNDEVRYDRDAANGGGGAVNVNLATGIATDGFGNTDTLISIELARGTSGADQLTGGNAASYTFEAFYGLGGNDTISGGDGFDELRYDQDASYGGVGAVNVNFATGQVTDGFGATDTVSGVQHARGTAQADTFFGGGAIHQLGEAFSGLAGNDSIDGGAGFDEARYDQDANFGGAGAVTVNLVTGIATDGFGNTDTLVNIDGARGTAQADTFTGNAAIFNFFQGLGGADIIDGGDGTDEARYDQDANNGGTAGVIIDLGAGTAIDGFGAQDTLISIERARGTNSVDSITGSDDDNQLMGLGGGDTIDGGDGNDEVRYDFDHFRGGSGAVLVNLADGTATDGFGDTDTLTGIENARGSRFADTFIGSDGDNVFYGLAGDDDIDGGAGSDWVSFSNDLQSRDESQLMVGTFVNLATGEAVDSFGDEDTLTSIENAAGANLADILIGNAGDNIFRGLAGADQIDGAGGIDTVDYSADRRYGESVFMNGANGVAVDLSLGMAVDGFGSLDDLDNIENVIGTEFADTLIGNGSANVLTGLGGNDTLDGGGGADTLVGGLGDDTYIVDDFGDVVTEAVGEGTDTVETSLSFYQLLDGSNVENLTFTNSATVNVGFGSSFDNVLTGTTGTDSLTGNFGNDTYAAGDGSDFLFIDHMDTNIDGGAGYDAAYVQDVTGVNLDVAAANLEFVFAWAGDDTLDASDATWSVTLVGEAGADVLRGGSGNDYLYIDAADTVIDAGAGYDALFVNTGTGTSINVATANAEWVLGNSGNDTLNASGTSWSVALTGGAGADQLLGGSGNDYIFADAADTAISGGAGFDALFLQTSTGMTIDANALGVEWVLGGSGADTITNAGGSVGVALLGAAGEDTLTGGLGSDFLYGGSGGADSEADTFVVTSNAQSDYIVDFVSGTDQVDLQAILGIDDFDDLLAVATQVGSDVLFDLGSGNQLTLIGASIPGLAASDFIFHP